MSKFTLIEVLDETKSLIENIKNEILSSENDTLINASFGEGVSKLITIHANVDEENKDALNLHLKALSTFLDALGEEDLELQGLEPNAQIQAVNRRLDLFGDNYVTQMRNIISLPEKFHVDFKSALNAATGNLMGKMGIQEIVNKTTKAERDKLTGFSDSIPYFLKRMEKAMPSFIPIVFGAQTSLLVSKQELNVVRASEQYLRMQRVFDDLKELSKLREELESEEYAFLFGRRSGGNIPDIALKNWVFEIWYFLTNLTNVKPTLSRDAKITALMQMGLERLNLGLTSSKIYDIAEDIRNSQK